MAAHHVPDARRRAVLGRHLFPEGAEIRPARLRPALAGSVPHLPRRARADRAQPVPHHSEPCRSCRAERRGPDPGRPRPDRRAPDRALRPAAASRVRPSSRTRRSSNSSSLCRAGAATTPRSGGSTCRWSAALGGIHDHLAGGFARYSPTSAGSCRIRRCSTTTRSSWSSMRSRRRRPDGRCSAPRRKGSSPGSSARWSCRTAVSRRASTPIRKEEGRFYVWRLAEIRDALGEEAAFFAHVYDVSEDGNWERVSILNRLDSGEAPPDVEERLEPLRRTLLARREAQAAPASTTRYWRIGTAS